MSFPILECRIHYKDWAYYPNMTPLQVIIISKSRRSENLYRYNAILSIRRDIIDTAKYSKGTWSDQTQKDQGLSLQPRADAKSNEEAWLSPTVLKFVSNVRRHHSDDGR
jgi:hypothetical protein